MKKQIQSLLLVALFIGITTPAWGQASTEGKEFWVAIPYATGPNGTDAFEPFIAISAKKACTITISQPAGDWGSGKPNYPIQQFSVAADSWTMLSNGQVTIKNPPITIPDDVWYDKTGWTTPQSASEPTQPFKYGIFVQATENISVYAAMRLSFSYDASNILPVTALGSDYILQEYPPYNSGGDAHSVFMIVATEDGTVVDITPSTPTIRGKSAGTTFSVNLDKGQSYQVVSTDKQSFSGTTISEQNGKKIAVFSAADFTQVPGGKSARDCLYEQAIPTKYWGTHFVVTRSLEKDANRVRITALEDNTTIRIDGVKLAQKLQRGKTYEFEMSEDLANSMSSAISGAGRTIPDIFNGEAHYIETSCPCAVFSYDVSSDYRFSSTTKIGDPSMVWISPLEQRISKITFGACGTKGAKSNDGYSRPSDEGWTNKHYVNVVCLTTDTASFSLKSNLGNTYPAHFTVVPGNTTYSYARVFLVDTKTNPTENVFTMSNSKGFVAHVYGSGNNESYAYSAGSAAVEYGVDMNGEYFTDGNMSSEKYCLNTVLAFDASIGSNAIERVDWDFGDGITLPDGPAIVTHIYTSPGWYDVKATLYGHQLCTDEATQEIGTVNFAFPIVRQDTALLRPQHHCLTQDEIDADPVEAARLIALTEGELIEITPDECYDTVFQYRMFYGMSTVSYDTVRTLNSYYEPLDGNTYPRNPDNPNDYHVDLVLDPGVTNQYDCDSIIYRHVDIKTCLDLSIDNNPAAQTACQGHTMDIMFQHRRGDIGPASVNIGGHDYEIEPNGSFFTLPVADQRPGYYSTVIQITDTTCDNNVLKYPIDYSINYRDSIFNIKFNNVLAVYKSGFGGNDGYDFTAYQWVKNGEPIEGATSSVYHSEEPFAAGDAFYVILTDRNGMVLPSCPKILEIVKDFTPQSSEAAQKVIRNQRMYILFNNEVFDMFGQKIQ